jgi:hypothetical protein
MKRHVKRLVSIVTPAELDEIDCWRRPRGLTRPEAVRLLVKMGLQRAIRRAVEHAESFA